MSHQGTHAQKAGWHALIALLCCSILQGMLKQPMLASITQDASDMTRSPSTSVATFQLSFQIATFVWSLCIGAYIGRQQQDRPYAICRNLAGFFTVATIVAWTIKSTFQSKYLIATFDLTPDSCLLVWVGLFAGAWVGKKLAKPRYDDEYTEEL